MRVETCNSVLRMPQYGVALATMSLSLCVAGKQKEGLGGLGYNGMTSAIADEINANKMLNY